MLQPNASARFVTHERNHSASSVARLLSIVSGGAVSTSSDFRTSETAGTTPETSPATAVAAAQVIREAGAVVAALAAIPPDDEADALLGKLFRDHAPRALRRPLPKKAR